VSRSRSSLCRSLVFAIAVAAPSRADSITREIRWDDLARPLQQILEGHGLSGTSFTAYIAGVRARNQQRVREGELDHLVYYALQSTSFTTLPPIEPALSAKAFTERRSIPPDAEARVDALLAAMDRNHPSPRLGYFQEIATRQHPDRASRRSFILGEYARAMRFLYDKEFVAAAGADAAAATGLLYQQRGLSTDTSVEAGYLVDLGLATLRELEPRRRIRDVLIIGPGLDVAPRTGLVESGEPQSDQPFAVIDSLLRHGLAQRATLHVTAADINAHVVDWVRGARGTRPRLTLVSGIRETDRVRFTDEYRRYFETLGRSIGVESGRTTVPGHLTKAIDLSAGITDEVDAATLDAVVDRFDRRFDLVVVTNVFPYLTDAELTLALANIGLMLASDGILLHNEPRPLAAAASRAAGLSPVHSRSAIVATVEGGRSPLYDAIWMFRAR
jgi:hypothetical protein